MNRYVIFTAAIVLLVVAGGAAGGAAAFEDTAQRYPTGDVSDYWQWSSGHGSAGTEVFTVVNYPTAYPTSNSLYFYFHGVDAWQRASPHDMMSTTYLAFTVRSYTASGYIEVYICYYDEDGDYITSTSDLDPTLHSYHANDLYEFIKAGNSVVLYVNGVSKGQVATIAPDAAYVELYADEGTYNNIYFRFDDFTSEGNVIGMNEEWTEAITYIDTSYSVRSMFSFPDAEYDMSIKRVTTGETINTTILPSNQSAGDKPCGFMRYNRNDVFGTNYGLYQMTLNRDGSKIGETTFVYLYSQDLGSVAWGKDTYSIGETANIPYSLVSPDFGSYTYKIETMGINGVVDDTWTISDISGTKTAALSNYDTGTKYAIFSRTDKASGDVVEFSYDYATLTESVVINGNTTNAVTGEVIGNADVNFTQGTEWYNTTTASDGTYNLTDLSTSVSVTCDASATITNYTQTVNETFNSSNYDTWISLNHGMISDGSVLVSNTTDETPFTESTDYSMNYTDGKIMALSTGSMINWTDYHIDYNTTQTFNIEEFTFTPLAAKVYYIDLYLFNVNHTYENTSVYGLVGDSNYRQAVENATVTIWNATWNSTTQTTATGYYVFHNLNNTTTYNLKASADGYTTSSGRDVAASGNATRQDILLAKLYTVIIKAKDASTTAYLNDYTAYFGSQQNLTTTGTASFYNVEYGMYSISVAADDYYPDATTELIDEDTTITISLTRTESRYYSPHYVRFVLMNIMGSRYADVATTVKEGTSGGDEYASGITGTDGAVVFKMTENVQYTVTFTNATQGIDKTIVLYPEDTRYVIIIGLGGKWTEYEDRPMDSIHINVKKSIINDTHAYINVTYRDDTNGTLQLMVWINQTNPHDPRNPTGIASHTFSGDLNDTTHSFVVSDYKGQSYQVRVWHEHDQFGTFYDRSVRFAGMLIDLGLPSAFYFWFAIGTLFFVAAIFGATTTSVGSIVVCALGWVFLAIGWLAALGIFGPISLTLASVYAVANNLITRHHRGGFA
jgi:hypothetical protein